MASASLSRIKGDIRDMERNRDPRFQAKPLPDDLYHWHFTIRGPPDTPFEGGVYHGRIVLPPEYPFKPPNIYFLTENGRFEINTKICLSISAHHPESWQPAWGIRLILEALISLLPTPADGAIGGLDTSDNDRKILAQRSRQYKCPQCGYIKDLLLEETEESKKTGSSEEVKEQLSSVQVASQPSPKNSDEDDEEEAAVTNTVHNTTTTQAGSAAASSSSSSSSSYASGNAKDVRNSQSTTANASDPSTAKNETNAVASRANSGDIGRHPHDHHGGNENTSTCTTPSAASERHPGMQGTTRNVEHASSTDNRETTEGEAAPAPRQNNQEIQKYDSIDSILTILIRIIAVCLVISVVKDYFLT